MPIEKKYFRDPIHGFIKVEGCALKIVNCLYFQRLRRIKQLGFACYVYHGAEHSRFGHSLGTYHLAKRIVDKLIPQNEKELKEEFCLAALLHDIGHHPLSHSFEFILTSKEKEENEQKKQAKHENYTEAIIENTVVGDYIEKYNLNKNNVIKLIQGKYLEREEYAYLNGLISSELDVDRLDYLQRDAYYCGVSYGTIDLDRMIVSLEVETGEIIVNEKGIQTVEMYILARFYMYTQVYLHHTSRAFDIMLKEVFNNVNFDELNYPKPIEEDIERIINYDDLWLIKQIKRLSRMNYSLETLLASNILTRNPLRWVVRKRAFADAQTLDTDPVYSNIVNLANDFEDIAKRAGVETETLYIDGLVKDLPFHNKYRPYLSSEGEKDIKVRTGGKIQDIALDSSSLVFYIAKRIAQAIRIYTLQENREKVVKAIINKYPNLKQFVWQIKKDQ